MYYVIIIQHSFSENANICCMDKHNLGYLLEYIFVKDLLNFFRKMFVGTNQKYLKFLTWRSNDYRMYLKFKSSVKSYQ